MSAVGRSLNVLLRHSLITVLLIGALATTRAEVSVVVDPVMGGSSRGSIFLASIVDAPDPILGIWARYGQNAGRAVLNEAGAARGDGPPTVLGNPVGVCAVAWARNSSAGFDVVMSQFVGDAWMTEEILAGGPQDELDPFLVSGSDGVVHLFYWEAGTPARVMERTAPPDLSSWTPAVEISEPGVISARPTATFHDDVLWVAYEVHDQGLGQTPRQIVAARFENGQWVREVLAVSYAAEPLRPEIHSRAGQLWVDWIDAPGQSLWIRRESPSAWSPVQTVPYSTELERDYFVRGTIRDLVVQ